MDDAEAMVAFLNARLDEREAVARGAADASAAAWRAEPNAGEDWWAVMYTGPSTIRPCGEFDYPVAERVDRADAAHIALHDPARVLREVEADRRLIEAYEWVAARKADGGGIERDYNFRSGQAISLETAIGLRVAVHSDHPDYREEWKP